MLAASAALGAIMKGRRLKARTLDHFFRPSLEMTVKAAAYQAPLAACGSVAEALALIREQVDCCESAGVEILCCPEAILGGLADYAEHPTQFAIATQALDSALVPLTSYTVTTIVGFTEL